MDQRKVVEQMSVLKKQKKMLKIKENHETFQNYGLCLLKTDRQTNQTTYRLDLYMPYESSKKIQYSAIFVN